WLHPSRFFNPATIRLPPSHHGQMDYDSPLSGTPLGKSSFPPIDDYAFLSDCESTCLIARDGTVEWMCVPRPDSPRTIEPCLPRAGTCRAASYSKPPGRPTRGG